MLPTAPLLPFLSLRSSDLLKVARGSYGRTFIVVIRRSLLGLGDYLGRLVNRAFRSLSLSDRVIGFVRLFEVASFIGVRYVFLMPDCLIGSRLYLWKSTVPDRVIEVGGIVVADCLFANRQLIGFGGIIGASNSPQNRLHPLFIRVYYHPNSGRTIPLLRADYPQTYSSLSYYLRKIMSTHLCEKIFSNLTKIAFFCDFYTL